MKMCHKHNPKQKSPSIFCYFTDFSIFFYFRSEPANSPSTNESGPERMKARSVDHSSDGFKKLSDSKILSGKSSSSSLSVFPSSTPTTTDSPYKTSEFYIIRVSVEGNGPETEGKCLQKVLN